LKAFEYIACGLPVVSIPIDDLQPWPELITFASSAEAFAAALREAVALRSDPQRLRQRAVAARAQSYDDKFAQVTDFLLEVHRARPEVPEAENVLVLIDRGQALDLEKQRGLLELRSQAAPCNLYFAPATGNGECPYNLSAFDTIVIHSSVTLGDASNLAPSVAAALRDCLSRKILLVEDVSSLPPDVLRGQRELGIQEVHAASTPTVSLFRPGPLAKLPLPVLHLLQTPRAELESSTTAAVKTPRAVPRSSGILRKLWRYLPEWLRRPLRPSLWGARALKRTLVN
jgi:hypothetical protein